MFTGDHLIRGNATNVITIFQSTAKAIKALYTHVYSLVCSWAGAVNEKPGVEIKRSDHGTFEGRRGISRSAPLKYMIPNRFLVGALFGKLPSVAELGYFNTVSAGCRDPGNVIFSPWNANFTRLTPPKNVYFTLMEGDFFLPGDPPPHAIGLVLVT